MSIQQPAWLKRARPCPFFSQGRCLFADSCNFLHDVRVRNAVHQPLLGTRLVEQPSPPPKPVFDPPSVVVNSASPRSVNLASPQSSGSSTQDSSRYSGLLSVLSDVIGPPPTTAEDAVPSSRTTSTLPSSSPSESNAFVAGVESASTSTEMETGQSAPSRADESSILELGSKATLVDPFRDQGESFFPKADVAVFLPVSNEEAPIDGDAISYFGEDTNTYIIGSEPEEDDKDTDDRGEEDPTVMLSSRHSTLSSFTGASLLASPRHSVFGEPSVASPTGSGAADLLSPVQLSAKLRPFSIPSMGFKVKRGDSIDSGYADGESWTSPVPFPHSPPGTFRSPVMFPSHSRRASASSPSLKDIRVSYNAGALRPSPYNRIEVIKEVEFDGCLEDNEDTALAILGAYGTSPSEGLGEGGACHPLQVNVAEDRAEEDDKPLDVPGPRRHPPDHLHPITCHDLDLSSQPSFISNDNLSFKTALSLQHSYDSLSDISRQSPVKQDSLLAYLSGCSTPNTSVLSHYGDANEFLEQSVTSTHVCEPSDPVSQIDSTGAPESTASEERPLLGETVIGSDLPLGSASADDLQGLDPEKVVTPRESLSGAVHSDRRYLIPSSSVDSSHGLSPAKDLLGYALPDANGNDSESSRPPSTVLHDSLPEHVAVEADQSLAVENSLGSDEVTECLDSEGGSFTRRLSFPLPPPFLPAEVVGNSTLNGEDTSVRPEAAVGDFAKDMPNAHAGSLDADVEQIHSGSDLTEKARPSQLPSVEYPNTSTDFTLRRSRAVSDITVKGKSPPATPPADTPYILRSPPPPLEQPGRSDSVRSLYDQYFDESASDGLSEFSSPSHEDTAPPDTSSLTAEPSQEDHLQSLDLTPLVFQRISSSSPDSEVGDSGTGPPRSEAVFRPLLTGRRSFLRSSLAELIPKANPKKSSSHTNRSTRVQARQIGSTMVPLGFRRHKPQPAATQSSQPLRTTLSASELRGLLRIRTDIARENLPPGCSSASHVPSSTWSPLPAKAMSAPPTSGLRQLRLSTLNKRSSIFSTNSSSIASSILSLDHSFNSPTPQSPSVSSTTSFSHSSSLSSSCKQIPEQIHHTLNRSSSSSPILQANHDVYLESQSYLARRDSCFVSAPTQQPKSWRLSHYRAGSRNYTPVDGTRRCTRRASTLSLSYTADEEQEINEGDSAMSRSIQSNHADDWTHPGSVFASPIHAIATPKPNLLFAIASDDVDQVCQVLESGEAGPNDSVGPQSALAFTLTNNKLTHKQEIVKALLAYGANPSALRNPALNPAPRKEGDDEPSEPPPETTLEGMDPATRYFVTRADAAHTRETSRLIYRSFFRPLTRVRYDVIGQDWALEQLFRVLSMHSQKLAVAPIVVLLCGPSGHGKSLLARKFGFLLDVPTHTVNMTTLRSPHDIWQSYSLSPYEDPSSCTLAEFLIDNEGKRCVVVLDEIEKIEDQKALWSLLMPWELGQCSLEAGKRHVDARNVIWMGTSNIGHELVFEHHQNRAEPDERMSREDYLELTAMLRPDVSHCLGASLVSRVTTVLPFVPFTLYEKKAIAAEAVYALASDTSRALSPQEVESLVTKALPSYRPSEGARSLHRAISNILVDMT